MPFVRLSNSYGSYNCADAAEFADHPGPFYGTIEECQGEGSGGGTEECPYILSAQDDIAQNRVVVTLRKTFSDTPTNLSETITAVCAGANQTPTNVQAYIVGSDGSGGETRNASTSDNCNLLVWTFARVVGNWTWRTDQAHYGGGGASGCPLFATLSIPAPDCTYFSSPINIVSQGEQLLCSVDVHAGWSPSLSYFLDDRPTPPPALSIDSEPGQATTVRWSVERARGTHEFILEWSKHGCQPHIENASVSVDEGSGGGSDCTFVEPSPNLTFFPGGVIVRLLFQPVGADGTSYTTNGGTLTPGTLPTQPMTISDGSGIGGQRAYLAAFPFQVGTNTLSVKWTKPGCPDRFQNIVIPYAGEPGGGGGGDPTPCPPTFEGDGWYCVAGVPTRISTYESWVAANQPFPRYASAILAPCGPQADTLLVEWQTPAVNQDVRGVLGLRAKVTAPRGLWSGEGDAVEMFLNGSKLSGTRQFGSVADGGVTVWQNRFDPRSLDFQGQITFEARAKTAQGLVGSAFVTVSASLSLAKLTRYEHNGYAPTGKPLGQMALAVLLDERAPRGWIDAFVSSPGSGKILPYDDFAAMEEELLSWQNVAFDDVFSLLGAEGKAATERMEVVLRFTPDELETRFALGASTVARVRRISNTKIEVLTLDPARVLEVTPDGGSVVMDIAARGLQNILDARRWRDDKVVVVTSSGARVCEVNASAADFLIGLSFKIEGVWQDETRPCIGVEVVDDGSFLLIYADATGTRVWQHDGTDPVIAWQTSEQILWVRAQGKRVAFVTQSNAIWEGVWATNALAPTKRFQHTAPIVALAFDDTDALVGFADVNNVYALLSGALDVAIVGSAPVGVSWRASGVYKGTASTERIVAGGTGSAGAFWRGENGGFGPFWTVGHGAQSVVGLGHFLRTYVEAEGDPLMEGTPAVESDVLAMFVETGAPGGAFVALVERARQTNDSSTWARGVQRLVMVPK